jgi:hypothetical protein
MGKRLRFFFAWFSTSDACLFKGKKQKKSDGEFGHGDLEFCLNLLVAMHKFETERVMLV